MPGRVYVQGSETREGFTGHELDAETGHYHAGKRYYMPALGRWTTTDPLNEYPSPYVYVGNNPISLTDPTGMLSSPIYNTAGDFLGTDDEVLQEKVIVMNEDDFSQGMSHESAVAANLGRGGLVDDAAYEKLVSDYSDLEWRPDYDGFVGIGEGIRWAKTHRNSDGNPHNALYLDASKLNFGSLSVSDVFNNLGIGEREVGNVNHFNYVLWPGTTSRATTYALGNTQIKMLADSSAYSDGL